MDHMEDSEDEAAPRGYDDLAAAMAADGAESSSGDEGADDSPGEDGEASESGGSESGRSFGSGGSMESDAMFGDSSDEEGSGDSGEGLVTALNQQMHQTWQVHMSSKAVGMNNRNRELFANAHSEGSCRNIDDFWQGRQSWMSFGKGLSGTRSIAFSRRISCLQRVECFGEVCMTPKTDNFR
jgi:hypothetical protein